MRRREAELLFFSVISVLESSPTSARDRAVPGSVLTFLFSLSRIKGPLSPDRHVLEFGPFSLFFRHLFLLNLFLPAVSMCG